MSALAMPTPKTGATSPVAVSPTVGSQPGTAAYDKQYQSQYGDNFNQLVAEGYSPDQVTAMMSPWASYHNNQDAAATYNKNNQLTAFGGSQPYSSTAQGAANGIQYAGYVPGWNSSMNLANKYQNEVDQNSGGFNFMRSQALTPGPTQWATNQKLLDAQMASEQKDKGAADVAATTAQANDALAAQGGLSSGARERVAEGGAKNMVGMDQGIAQTNLNNQLTVGTTDESNKMNMLGQVAGQEAQRSSNWMQANQYDQGQQTAENERLNAYNKDLAAQKNAAYAAQQQANATSNSGK